MEPITVDDLILKQIPGTQEFAQQIYDIFTQDIDTFKYWFQGGMWKAVDEVQRDYQKRNNTPRWKYAMYGIFQRDELLGEIGLSLIDTKNQTAKIGYWLKKSARGQGLIDRLIPVIEKIGFEKFNLKKLDIHCEADNIASVKHAEKNGFILKEIQHDSNIWPDGSVHSELFFSKLKSEWKKQFKNKG